MLGRYKIKLLDLFCGVGGASAGYAEAGFEVTGMDLKHGKRYPFTYKRGNVMALDLDFLQQFDVIHASPPCQTYSITQHLRNAQGKSTTKLDLLEPVRTMLLQSGKPYIIENVKGAPLLDPVQLCGSSFGLAVRRHRLFESNLALTGSLCNHTVRPVGVYGSMRDQIPGGGKTADTIEQARQAMGIEWALWGELVEAIPPAYTKFIGLQIVDLLNKSYPQDLKTCGQHAQAPLKLSTI